jgi:hypothetical protein
VWRGVGSRLVFIFKISSKDEGVLPGRVMAGHPYRGALNALN